jgi:hypothetical protein
MRTATRERHRNDQHADISAESASQLAKLSALVAKRGLLVPVRRAHHSQPCRPLAILARRYRGIVLEAPSTVENGRPRRELAPNGMP